jgi:hypothetical protein
MLGLPISAVAAGENCRTQQARRPLPCRPEPAVAATVGHPPARRPLAFGEIKWLIGRRGDHGDPVVNDDINVLALIKGKERYIFLYDDSQRAETLRMLGRHASNPELSFSWYDAAVLSQKIRQEERQQKRSRLRMPQVTDSEELF